MGCTVSRSPTLTIFLCDEHEKERERRDYDDGDDFFIFDEPQKKKKKKCWNLTQMLLFKNKKRHQYSIALLFNLWNSAYTLLLLSS